MSPTVNPTWPTFKQFKVTTNGLLKDYVALFMIKTRLSDQSILYLLNQHLWQYKRWRVDHLSWIVINWKVETFSKFSLHFLFIQLFNLNSWININWPAFNNWLAISNWSPVQWLASILPDDLRLAKRARFNHFLISKCLFSCFICLSICEQKHQ